MHHLVFIALGQHPWWRWLGAVLVGHKHIHLRPERSTVEIERLFAATTKEQIRLNSNFRHDDSRLEFVFCDLKFAAALYALLESSTSWSNALPQPSMNPIAACFSFAS